MPSQLTYFKQDDTNKLEGDVHFNRIQFFIDMMSASTQLAIIWQIYEEEVLFDEDSQIKESFQNLKNGDYADYNIDEYLKTLEE